MRKIFPRFGRNAADLERTVEKIAKKAKRSKSDRSPYRLGLILNILAC